uniref:Uncharacterized protein n=1 Tax=Glossina austeni TaxID=7395 RepID=A0A1A9UDE2_GLOAU
MDVLRHTHPFEMRKNRSLQIMATSAVLSSQSLHHHHLKSELPLIPARPKIVKHLKCYNNSNYESQNERALCRSDVYKNDNTACKNLPYMCSIEDNTKFLFLPRRSISKSSSLIQSHLTSATSRKTPLKFIEQAPLVTVDSPLQPICKKSSSDPILCSHVSTQKQRCLTCNNTKQYFRKKMCNHAVFPHTEPTLSSLSAKTSPPSLSWAKEESYIAATTLNTISETTDNSRLESSAIAQITSKEKHHSSDGSDCSLGLPLHLFCYKNKLHHIKLWYRFIAATASPRILNQHSTLTSHQTVTAMIKVSDSTSTSATSRKTLHSYGIVGNVFLNPVHSDDEKMKKAAVFDTNHNCNLTGCCLLLKVLKVRCSNHYIFGSRS